MGNSNKEFLDGLNSVLNDLRKDYFLDDKNKAARVGSSRRDTTDEGFQEPAGDDDTSGDDGKDSRASQAGDTHTSG